MSINRSAFTLIELMVVVTIVGILAAFAIPNYSRSVERAHRRDAENNLLLVHATQQMFFANNNNTYWNGGGGTLPEINATLGMNIIANGMTYSCAQTRGNTTFDCTAVRIGGAAFTITVTEAPIVNPGGNPSCAPALICANQT